MMWIIVAFLGGIGVGLLVGRVYTSGNTIGNLRVDQSDPSEPPYLFLELSEGVHTVTNKKTVHLKVRVENFVSQK